MNVVAEAYLAACLAELDALKPGNVHRHAPGHGMTVADFEASARVSAPLVAAPGVRVGARILRAVEATRAAVGQNTNLGILLLCAPLAAAFARPEPSLRAALAGVLADLDAEDARDAFAAIALANPGGLGAAEQHDVRCAPDVGLIEAMASAAERDLIARQYANGFADVLATGLPPPATDSCAIEAVYLTFLVTAPDSHISRKFGRKTAEAVRRDAAARTAGLKGLDPAHRRAALTAWDADLKSRGLNTGTSADLPVATVFAASLTSMREEWLAKRGRQ